MPIEADAMVLGEIIDLVARIVSGVVVLVFVLSSAMVRLLPNTKTVMVVSGFRFPQLTGPAA